MPTPAEPFMPYLWLHISIVVMSKTKGQTFRYSFGNETKTFSLIENRLFRFGPESALLGQIDRISFDKKNSEKNSMVFFYSYYISERLWNVCSFTVLTLLVNRQEDGVQQHKLAQLRDTSLHIYESSQMMTGVAMSNHR